MLVTFRVLQNNIQDIYQNNKKQNERKKVWILYGLERKVAAIGLAEEWPERDNQPN
jgi:hypothetical protein